MSGKPALDLSGLKEVKLNATNVQAADLSKAHLMTQSAIENLGGPMFASMTDHKPVDESLNRALIQTAINKQGEISVPSERAPMDRAISEALMLRAIASDPQSKLKAVGEVKEAILDKAALLEDINAEKTKMAKSRSFGGGDAKNLMGSIMSEINNQGGAIAVPSEKAKVVEGSANVALTQMKTLAQINALGGPVYASMTDHAPVDNSMAINKTMYAITHQGGHVAVPEEKSKNIKDKAILEAQMMCAISSERTKAQLKDSIKPAEGGLTTEQLQELLNAAKLEKA